MLESLYVLGSKYLFAILQIKAIFTTSHKTSHIARYEPPPSYVSPQHWLNSDLVEIADALGDMMYILCGTILAHGLQDKIEDIFEKTASSDRRA